MPALLSHHLFGKTVVSKMGGGAFPTINERAAFLLGNQGPDPLFYALFTPAMREVKRFGSVLHSERVDMTIDVMRDYACSLEDEYMKIIDAYLCGFICHFTLDSIEHPLILSQQEAIISAGILGLDETAASVVHGQIETDLDAMMLYRSTGKTVKDYQITKHVLQGDALVLSLLDEFFNHVAWRAHDVILPDDVFSRSVKDMRTSVRVLQSRSGLRRTLLGYGERLVRPHSLMQAMSHRVDVGRSSEFDNAIKEPWKHPFTGEISEASFSELFDVAIEVAVKNLRLYADGSETRRITSGLDFSGRPQ
ncbi:MAG: hypothetical protein GX562_03030 [Coriobacteriaceae bacterium]|nr:hypothetical protein [Coriobacteriaceae bacterium]